MNLQKILDYRKNFFKKRKDIEIAKDFAVAKNSVVFLHFEKPVELTDAQKVQAYLEANRKEGSTAEFGKIQFGNFEGKNESYRNMWVVDVKSEQGSYRMMVSPFGDAIGGNAFAYTRKTKGEVKPMGNARVENSAVYQETDHKTIDKIYPIYKRNFDVYSFDGEKLAKCGRNVYEMADLYDAASKEIKPKIQQGYYLANPPVAMMRAQKGLAA